MVQSVVIIHTFNLFVQLQLECLTWKWFIGEVKVTGGGLLFDSFNLVQVHVSMRLYLASNLSIPWMAISLCVHSAHGIS